MKTKKVEIRVTAKEAEARERLEEKHSFQRTILESVQIRDMQRVSIKTLAQALEGKRISVQTLANTVQYLNDRSRDTFKRTGQAVKLDKAIAGKMSTGENDASNRVMLPRDRGMVARNRQRVNGANSRKGGAAYYARVKASRMVDTFIIEGQIQRAARTIVRLETRDTSTMNARDRRSHTRSLDHAEITLYHLLGIVNCPCKDCAE